MTTKPAPREWWIFKGTSKFADELRVDYESDSLEETTKGRPDGFYDLVSPNDTIEGGIYVIEMSAYCELLERLKVFEHFTSKVAAYKHDEWDECIAEASKICCDYGSDYWIDL